MPADDSHNADVIPLITPPDIGFDVQWTRDPAAGKPALVVITITGIDHTHQQSGPLPMRSNGQIAVTPLRARELANDILNLPGDC